MSYLQLENFGGKTRGLKFNQLALEVFTKTINYQNVVSSTIYATFYAGLMGNSYAKQEEPDYTFEQVTDWVDSLNEEKRVDDIKRVCDQWAETHIYREWLKEFQERVRAILEPEETKIPKKKMKSNLNGTLSTNLHLEPSA